VTRYLLDSDTCIFGLRDNERVVQKLLMLHSSDWAISSLTAFELQRGITRQTRPDVARQTADLIQAAMVFNFGRPEAAKAASIEDQLRKLGKPIGVVDILIAAHALTLGLTLVTNNTKHFEEIPGLKLENWL